jgi:hypothetical protein
MDKIITSSSNYINDTIPSPEILKNNSSLLNIIESDTKNKPLLIDPMSSDINTSPITYSTYLSKLSTTPTLPDTLDLRNNIGGFWIDRHTKCSREAYVVACMIEWHLNVIGEFKDYLSPAFINVNLPNTSYTTINVKSPSDISVEDKLAQVPSTLSDACDVVANIGICSESSYPLSNLKSIVSPKPVIPESVIMEAQKYKYRISKNVKINSVDDLKTSLYLNGPCIAFIPICRDSTTNRIIKFTWNSISSMLIGFSTMMIVGYDSNSFILRYSDIGTNLGFRDSAFGLNSDFSGFVSNLKFTDFPYLTSKYFGEIWTTIDLSQTTPPFNLGNRLSTPQSISLPLINSPLTNSPLTNSPTKPNSFILIIGVVLIGLFSAHMYYVYRDRIDYFILKLKNS